MPESTTVSLEKAARALVYLIYFFVMVALVILVFGFFLLLFGANPDASFSEWVYRSMDRVMAPFRGIFEPVEFTGNSILDTSVLFAMIVYGILGMVLRSLIDWLTYKIAQTQVNMQDMRTVGYGTAPASSPPPPTQTPPSV